MRPYALAFVCISAFGQTEQYNSVYRGDDGDVVSRKPNAFLVEAVRQRKPGRALDVGMGQGATRSSGAKWLGSNGLRPGG